MLSPSITPLHPCPDDQARRHSPLTEPSGLVIFGVTGDLSRRKLIPAVYDLANRGLLPARFSLIGFARRQKPGEDIARQLREAAEDNARTPFREEVWAQLIQNMRFVQGDLEDDNAFGTLKALMTAHAQLHGTGGNFAFYLALPPAVFPRAVQQLNRHHLTNQEHGAWRRVVIEKPFGHDITSARELNAAVGEVFAPEQIFRIDHYLAKETVQNILALRFANVMFEPIWNHRYVDHVQITMAEDAGVGGRASYYDGTGSARDVIQNHLLQLLALTAMEEPAAFETDSLVTEKLKVLNAVRLPGELSKHTVRGQYTAGRQDGRRVRGFLEEEGVNPHSRTDTYAAVELHLDTPRWTGVPFYLRTGKRLSRRLTEIAVVFQSAHSPFDTASTEKPGRNAIVIRVQPDEGITARFGSKVPGPSMNIRDVTMDFSYGETFPQPSPEAYERLILDVLRGDHSLFPRTEEIELSWKILDPVEECWEALGTPAPYRAGTWGPTEADELLTREGRRWRRP